jgi:hypothetical protein
MIGKTIILYKVLEKMGILVAMTLVSLSLVSGTGNATAQEEGTPRRRPARLDLGFGQSPPGSHVIRIPRVPS